MNGSLFQQIIAQGLPYLEKKAITPRQWQVLHHLQDCRTQAMGSYQWHCNHCEQNTLWYCSCRDRHCPVCQGQSREQWLRKRQADVLPVAYHHVVFTLPHQFNGWATLHPNVLYKALFKAVWQTLSEFATPRHHMDGQLGMLAVLHTWGQSLCRHIHLHCLIPSGVLTKDNQWCGSRKAGYLFPVKALSVKFRGKMLHYLEEQANSGELHQVEQSMVSQTLNEAAKLKWNVYSKPTIGHTDAVVNYLARYCNRVGISESRLSLKGDNNVLMRYKDYRTNETTHMELSAGELIRRFLLHVLPKGFMRLRYYGFMANSIRRKSLTLIRKSLDTEFEKVKKVITEKVKDKIGPECPSCHHVGMVLIGIMLPNKQLVRFRTI
ncbi:IS91 family transposase [Colwellia sp. MSW7]|uniref:IS91 family transposase n=1 Tax=Colwellia maritima TaxID=2912588 RepID=A0ABS9X798_9GAMM|nr:IS91 family transposase [Colwellia maritima]MCI2286104.1 IS91 family transposase [Colwellia maritima]